MREFVDTIAAFGVNDQALDIWEMTNISKMVE